MLHILDGATTPLLPPSIYAVAGDRVKNMSFFLQIWYDYYLPMTFHARSDKDSHLLFSTLGIHNLTPPVTYPLSPTMAFTTLGPSTAQL